MKVVYLSKNKPSTGCENAGLSTKINKKIYFVDKAYQETLNSQGIAFVDITKEKEKYGFIGGSYSCSVESDWEKLMSYVTESGGCECFPEFYLYGGCVFAVVGDNSSDGVFSIYYCLKGEDVSRLTVSTSKNSGKVLNCYMLGYLKSHSKNVSDAYYMHVAETLTGDNKQLLFEKISKSYYCCPSSVYISQDKKVCKVTKDAGINSGCYYYTLTPKFPDKSLICVNSSPTIDSMEYEDITEEFLDWCNSICLSNLVVYTEAGFGKVFVEFMGAQNSVLLVSKYADNPEKVYNAHKEEIDKSVESYKKWVSSLKKYVTISNAKQYRKLFLDKLLWTGCV